MRFPDGSNDSLAALIERVPPGEVVELAPGRYTEALVIRRPVTIRGAGDLTRISVSGTRGVRVDTEGLVRLESVLIEGGEADDGGAIALFGGVLVLKNVHVRDCVARQGGGAIHVSTGELDATLLRLHDVRGDRGGALCAIGDAKVTLRDTQIHGAGARYGGAIALLGPVRAHLEGITIGRAHATVGSGGQAIYLAGAGDGTPIVDMVRVRLEDAPLGMPLVCERDHPGTVRLYECDMPRVVLDAPGVVDGGANNWR